MSDGEDSGFNLLLGEIPAHFAGGKSSKGQGERQQVHKFPITSLHVVR